jgi:hypothetical protein
MQRAPSCPCTQTWHNYNYGHTGNTSLSLPNNVTETSTINIGDSQLVPVLPMIFQYASGSLSEWGELRWVCKQWRDATMNRTALCSVAISSVDTDRACARLATLRKFLPVLNLDGSRAITDVGMRFLSTLPSLETLEIGTGSPMTDIALHCLSTCASLKSLRLDGCRNISRVGMSFLSTLSSLRELHLDDMCVTDDGMEALSSLSSLEVLTVYEPLFTGFSHKTIQSLSKLTSLTKLSLQWPSDVGVSIFHEDGISPLSALTSLRELCLENLCVTDAGMETLSSLHLLEVLVVTEAHDTDILTYDIEDMGVLSRLTSLENLVLQWPVDDEGSLDAGLQSLSALTSLVTLELIDIEDITDAGMQSLSAMVSLQCLRVRGRHLCTDTGIQALSTLTSLRVLLLSGCPNVTDTGLLSLRRLIMLEELEITSSQFTDAGMEAFKSLTQLYSLNLSGCSLITDAGIQNLYCLRKLEILNLNNCTRVGNESVRDLCKLPLLLELYVEETGLTDACSRQICMSLPDDSNLVIFYGFASESESGSGSD